MIKDAGEDLRLIAGEVARIEHEFKGAVNFTIVRSSEFKAVLDTLNVRFCFTDGIPCSFPFVPHRSFGTTVVEKGSVAVSPVSSSDFVLFARTLLISVPC